MEVIGIAALILFVVSLVALAFAASPAQPVESLCERGYHDWQWVGHDEHGRGKPWACRRCPARGHSNGAGGFGP